MNEQCWCGRSKFPPYGDLNLDLCRKTKISKIQGEKTMANYRITLSLLDYQNHLFFCSVNLQMPQDLGAFGYIFGSD